jgi:uncharacterized protein YodC (DUF2158 family)
MEEITVGAVVRLRSGGPEMTVTSIEPKACDCAWFIKGEVRTTSFPPEALEAAPKKPLTEFIQELRDEELAALVAQLDKMPTGDRGENGSPAERP